MLLWGLEGCCVSRGRRASGGLNLCRIQNYAADQPLSQLSQQRLRVSRVSILLETVGLFGQSSKLVFDSYGLWSLRLNRKLFNF